MELQMPSEYQVAWWNLENLVDEENAPASRRTDKVFRAIRNGIAGWTPQRRDRKVAQLASVIVQMNAGAGPDLLGVCEVENRFALDLLVDAVGALLPARDYGVVHADTDDARGIDVAFLYDRALLEVPPNETFFHVVMRRNATREIVQVNFRTRQGRTWSVFGNHWPSRSGGHLESAGYRHIAGETLSYFHRRALELIFTCCHPALGTEAQVALTLRTLGGAERASQGRAEPGHPRQRLGHARATPGGQGPRPGREDQPRDTSQTCSACGHRAPEYRESQAVFRCRSCGFAGHADVNAARNIAAGRAVTARGGVRVAGPANREPQLVASLG
jgi:hypothetical protein